MSIVDPEEKPPRIEVTAVSSLPPSRPRPRTSHAKAEAWAPVSLNDQFVVEERRTRWLAGEPPCRLGIVEFPTVEFRGAQS